MSASSSTYSGGRFICDNCRRVYRTKDSLTRHRHNHDHVSQHVCPACSLTFNRSDVLARHVRIHYRGRRRSPRACLPCKLAKMKCDAIDPCSRCVRSFQTCTYEAETGNSGHESTHSVRPLPQHSSQVGIEGVIQASTSILSEDGSIANLQNATVSTAYEADSSLNMITSAKGTIIDSNLPLSGFISTAAADLEPGAYFEMHIKPRDPLVPDSWSSRSDSWLQSLNMPLLSTDWLRQPGGIWNTNYLDMGIDSATNSMFNGADVLQSLDIDLSSSTSNTLVCTTLGSTVLPCLDNEPSFVSAGPSLFDTINNSFAEPAWFTSPNISISQQENFGSSKTSLSAPDTYSKVPLSRIPISMVQERIVNDLVNYAFYGPQATTRVREQRLSYWKEMGIKIEHAFLGQLSQEACPTENNALNYFVRLYLDNFHILWPLFRQKDFNADNLSPALYLILTSTGAMYSGAGGRLYGSMMIERIFAEIMTSKYIYEPSIEPIESVLTFMLLTQVSALYFGQRRGFLRAQHLGIFIVSHARKANLFDELDSSQHLPRISLELQFERFILKETRKRIAFGIFRADIFMSAVLNTRPLLSSEEINLQLPCPDVIWLNGDIQEWHNFVNGEKDGSGMLYSDLARISMDRSEPLPHLSLAEQDLILFASQESVWRFCHDPKLFDRMIGSKVAEATVPAESAYNGNLATVGSSRRMSNSGNTGAPPGPREDQIDLTMRKMSDLRLDYDRTVQSLQKWKTSFVGDINAQQLQTSRYRLLNSCLLYHLSFLRLKSDIGSLDQIISNLGDPTQFPQAVVNRIYHWCHTKNAEQALEHALAIWSLISKESLRRQGSRAWFNILSLISLYHAAMVVWAYAGSHEELYKKSLQILSEKGVPHGLYICRGNSRVLLSYFANLFRTVTSSFHAVSSFAETVDLMAKSPCPAPSLP